MPSDVVCLCIHNVYVDVHTLEDNGGHRGAFYGSGPSARRQVGSLTKPEAYSISGWWLGSACLPALNIEARGPTKAISSH